MDLKNVPYLCMNGGKPATNATVHVKPAAWKDYDDSLV